MLRHVSLTFACALVLASCATAQGPGGRVAAAGSADRGLYLVLRSCAGCHTVGGDAPSPDSHAPPFWRLAQRFPADALGSRLGQISRRGHIEMPPIYMTDEEIKDIAAYVASAQPPPKPAPVSRGTRIAARG